MKKRLTAILMVLVMSLVLLTGCEDNSSNSRSSRNSRNEESDDSAEALSFDIFNTTEDFDEMMDAYKEFYNEFCEENLKPYYEDQTEGDCAAMIVVNPDDNKFMMVIADIVGLSSSSGVNVDLCFYEYGQGEVKEYLIIPNIWTSDDGIFVGNIADGLYVSYPNSEYEYIHYKIENGEAKEISQTGDENTEWIDIDTNDGVYPYLCSYSLTERIFTDCDSYANNCCISGRLFESYLDYLKEHMPESITDLKVIYGDYLLENRVTTRPLTFIVYNGIHYYYVREEKLTDDNGRNILDDYFYNSGFFSVYSGLGYDGKLINEIEPDMRGYLFPCVYDLLTYEYPESIDGYEVYPHIEEFAPLEAALSDENYRIYQKYNRFGDSYVYRFVDIEGDGVPELLVSFIEEDGTTFYCPYYIYEGSVCEDYDNLIVIIEDQCVYGNIEENDIKVYELEYYSSVKEAWFAYNNLAYNN